MGVPDRLQNNPYTQPTKVETYFTLTLAQTPSKTLSKNDSRRNHRRAALRGGTSHRRDLSSRAKLQKTTTTTKVQKIEKVQEEEQEIQEKVRQEGPKSQKGPKISQKIQEGLQKVPKGRQEG